jgi:hypothetical protein
VKTASRVFSLLHLSLVPPVQASLLSFVGNREEWLRFALSKSFDFLGWGGAEYVWVPKSVDKGYIFGLIQGKKPYNFHAPPEDGGVEKEEDFWQGAFVFIDPKHHTEGQKVAIENDVLGRPQALAKSLFDHISSRDDAPFNALAELIFDESDFWVFAKESDNILDYVKFEFVVPNMWSPQNDLEEDLKETGKDTGSDRVDVTLRGKNGIKADSDRVRDGVKYASRGAGVIKAKNRAGKRFSSARRPTTVRVDDQELAVRDGFGIADAAKRVLGDG